MCTVTFIPSGDTVYLTSNRDEKHSRMTAGVPGKHFVNGYELLYPVDGDSGGSWIAARNNGDAAVLLNGGFVNHVPATFYGKSRGVVFIELIGADDPVTYFKFTDFAAVAPFTIVFYVGRMLIEGRWDGSVKHTRQLNATLPHIWSSVTLYTPETISERENWFRQWQQQTRNFTTENIFRFHRFGGKGDIENDFVINRQDTLYTVSITSLHIKSGEATMNYFDIKYNKAYAGTIYLNAKKSNQREALYARVLYRIRKAAIVACHWEYWPFHLLYAPIYLYWFYLSTRAGSFFFFSQANPRITNAGFTNERKSEIYDMMPVNYYPKTLLCENGLSVQQVSQLLTVKELFFPMIAKPDIGERGTRVALLHNQYDLETYIASCRVDFLLQEFISYEQEVGIFYYRIPGEESGRISGIVGKDFLNVTGDGVSTVEQLVTRNKRFFLQLPVLKKEYGNFLTTILPMDENLVLVPYGNHARGAMFIDLSNRITEQLTKTIDQFCRQVPEFYFGRLDIKFRSWEDLCEGNHYSVIELNGAGSEPTHIYDPSHSVFFAWKEIIRHLRILYKISKLNAARTGAPLMKADEGLKMLKEHSRYMKLISSVE
jgi:hypothetical protein